MKYVIAMKSGTTFEVEIKDFEKFIQSLQNTVLSGVSQNHYYAEGNVLLCIEDISAVYPLSAQHGVYSDAGDSVA